jgi:RHS repeat-associated protein
VYGRTLTATDLTATVTVDGTAAPVRTARSDGRSITTSYSPATGLPTQVTSTTPPAKAGDATTTQTVTTTVDPLRGQPLTKTDTNDKVTEFAYDALGRSTKVWLADRRNILTPNYEFAYRVADGKPVAVTTKTLNHTGGQISSHVLYDGFLRERQSQAPGPDNGRILADNFYDERGLITKTFAPYYATGAPSTEIFKPIDAQAVETQTHTAYDGVGRAAQSRQIAGNGDGGTVLATTETIYGGDRTTVIPPQGGPVTTTLVDARGHTTELRQHHSRNIASAYDTTTYAYTPHGHLAKVTDPAGNSWSYTYDQLGRQTTTDDPDKGVTTTVYDDRGQVISTKDARGTTLFTIYDNLGRRTELREGTATGTLRATWVYDTLVGAKGQLAESTRFQDGNAYTSQVTQYDRLYRPIRTAVVIPASEGALAGTYQTGTSYKSSGLVGGMSYSAAGALPGGGVVYTHEDQTLRTIAVSGQGMTTSISYSNTGKPLQYVLGLSSGGKKTWTTNTYEWGTQRLATSRVDREEQAGVDRHATYKYDELGNVLSIADVSRTGTDNQCFTYDYKRQVKDAWTQGTTTCAATPSASAVGGPAPYWNSYTYDKTGNRLTETKHDPAGDTAKNTERTYTYPAAGGKQPHTMSSVTTNNASGISTDNYTYDLTGNTTERPGQKLTWDAEGHLAKVTEGTKTTEYLYDTGGSRLLGRTATETTLYLGHTEVTLPKGATTAKATRYIDIGGGHQAIRTDDGTFDFTVADHHGTGQLAIDADTLTIQQRRTDLFGNPRGTAAAAWPGTKGFVGGTDDTKSTGLTHLGAREYDSITGRFISVDPLMDLADPLQMNGYTYANGNPTTNWDPTGLKSEECGSLYKCGGNQTVTTTTTQYQDVNTVARYYEKTVSWATMAEWRAQGLGNRYPGFGKAKQLTSWSNEHYDHMWKQNMAAGVLRWVVGNAEAAIPIPWTPSLTGMYDTAVTKLGVDTQSRAYKDGEGAMDAVSILAGGAGLAKAATQVASKGCKNSFTPGTEVLLADGTSKPIEEIEVGEEVLATDPETGETRAQAVTAEIKGEGLKNLVEITVAEDNDGENQAKPITATERHPFWVPALNTWVDAKDLKTGDWLQTSAGTHVQITAIRRWTAQHATVHNLTVADLHTYYVLAGATPVLVHNSGGACPLYRSDTRGPDEIFESGFEPRGDNMDLLEHASGYSRDSGYISTTTSESVAIKRGGNVYEIRGVDGVDVNKEFPGNPFAHERETAIPGRVDTSCIVACRLRDGTRVPNPNYGGG